VKHTKIKIDEKTQIVTLTAESQEEQNIMLTIWESEGIQLAEMELGAKGLTFLLGDGTGKKKLEVCKNPHEKVYRGCTTKCKYFYGCFAKANDQSESSKSP